MTTDYEGDFDDIESDFWEFWDEVVKYADKTGLPLSYIEEEFIVLGEFTPIELEGEIA